MGSARKRFQVWAWRVRHRRRDAVRCASVVIAGGVLYPWSYSVTHKIKASPRRFCLLGGQNSATNACTPSRSSSHSVVSLGCRCFRCCCRGRVARSA